MTHEELIAKAKEHARAFEKGASYDTRVAGFEKVSVQEAVIIHFESSGRDDSIRVFLDRASGDFIGAEYHPPG